MPTIKLEFPVWIQYKDKKYVARPLFIPTPVEAHERYEKALRGLTKTVQKQFNHYKSNRNNTDELLWYLFNPEFQFQTMELEFNYGQRFFNGNITVVWFRHQEYTIVCLPAFEHHYFIAREKTMKREIIMQEVERQVQYIARKHKKEYDEDLDLKQYTSMKSEFHTILEIHTYIVGEKIEIVGDANDFFRQFFRTNQQFEGRQEIQVVGHDLNDLYPSELTRAYYREEPVEELSRLVYNPENVPIVLLGKKKVGKTSVLHEVVYRYLERNQEKVFYKLDNIWNIDPSRLIAGMSVVGMWQRRLESIIDFIRYPVEKSSRQDKLYFNNIVALFRIGKSSQNNMTLSDVLKPYMQTRKVQVILEATPEEWDVVSELDRGFVDLFKVIRLHEPNEEISLRIISKQRSQLEKHYGLQMDTLALLRLVELQKRFSKNDVLIGTMAESLHQLATKYAAKEVSVQTVMAEFSTRTHLNKRITDTSIKLSKDEFYAHISQQLIGQEEAVHCLTDVLHLIKAQLNNPGRPFGSFLFIGPTGVGKTEAAKVLANYLFTHEDSLVRFDMNEFIDDYSVSRLVGDLTNPEGQLTTKIRYNSYCILLFDEIEKAHPDVHNLLLQVLGEGRLTDALGRTVNFCNTVIVMTSNLGAERVGREINIRHRDDPAAGTYEKAVRDFFRPEFINRIDRIVIFHKLTSRHIARIAWLQIKNLLKRHGFLRRHTILNVSREVLEVIAEKGFDPEMGGRALKRQIEKELTVLIADQLVEALPETPVIFNLYVHNQRLLPQIVRLEHIPAKPDIQKGFSPEEEVNSETFQTLLQEVGKLQKGIFKLQEEKYQGIDLFRAIQKDEILRTLIVMKDDLADLAEQLQDFVWEHEMGKTADLSRSRVMSANVSKVKIIRNFNHHRDPGKGFLRDLYSQLQINEYMQEAYEAAENIERNPHSYLSQWRQSIFWNSFFYHKYLTAGMEYALLKIASAVANDGKTPVDKLKNVYASENLKTYGFGEKGNENEYYILLKGVGIYDRWKYEEGYHLFFTPYETPLPVEVRLYPITEEESKPENIEKKLEEIRRQKVVLTEKEIQQKEQNKIEYIVRLYTISDNRFGKTTTTDLRTGIIQDEYINHHVLRFIWYTQLVKEWQAPVA